MFSAGLFFVSITRGACFLDWLAWLAQQPASASRPGKEGRFTSVGTKSILEDSRILEFTPNACFFALEISIVQQ